MPVKYFIYGILILIVLIILMQVAFFAAPILWLIGGILFGITCFVGLAMAIGCIIQILVEG